MIVKFEELDDERQKEAKLVRYLISFHTHLILLGVRIFHKKISQILHFILLI